MQNSGKKDDSNDGNHQVNPPGNPVLEQDVTEMERLMQKKYATVDDARISQTATNPQHSNPGKHPIKQPNKTTNNS